MTRLSYRLLKSILSTIFLLVASCSQSEEQELSILEDKPIFTVNVDGFNLAYSVKVNGVSVYNEYNHGGQVTLTVPVNHFVHPKENYFSIDVIPPEPGDPFKPSARVKATLNVHNQGNSDQKIEVATVVFSENGQSEGDPNKGSSAAGRYEIMERLEERPNGNVEVGQVLSNPSSNYEGSVLYERKITIPNSLPLWAFFDSDELPDYFKIPDEEYYPELESLLEEYLKVQSALETGDIDSVMPLFEERNRETDLAFYREPGTTEAGIRESLVESASDNNLKLAPLKTNTVHLFPEENEKLVKLVRGDNGAAVALNFVEGQGHVFYDLAFRRENGEWILTR